MYSISFFIVMKNHAITILFFVCNNVFFQTKLVPLIHHMGGSIRKDMSAKVTHLIANVSGGDKYQYAATFRVPVMNLQWVHASWEHRQELEFTATLDTFMVSTRLVKSN